MATSCAPNDLTRSSKCFSCLSWKKLKAVAVYLLCLIANRSSPCVNIIGPGTPYDLALGTQMAMTLETGANYKLVGGPNENFYDIDDGAGFVPITDGQVVFFTAIDTGGANFQLKTDLSPPTFVTAILCKL